MKALIFEARRSGYSVGQIADEAMTVGELKALLEDYDDDTLFVLSHDNGYTYGSISAHEADLFVLSHDNGYTYGSISAISAHEAEERDIEKED